jgi:hypothetical protein
LLPRLGTAAAHFATILLRTTTLARAGHVGRHNLVNESFIKFGAKGRVRELDAILGIAASGRRKF